MTLRQLRNVLFIALLAAVVAGCSSTGGRKRGGYYKDDGPDANPPSNLDSIPNAMPRIEPLAGGANRPYVVFGKRYVPITSDQSFTQRGIASWYGKKFHGNSTSNGESYDMYAMTAAHPTLPIPSYARVTSAINGRTIIVRVNDRGPFHDGRIMDLSYVAAYKLGIIGPGSGAVTVQRILPDEVRRMIAERDSGRNSNATASVTDARPLPPATVPAMAAAQATTINMTLSGAATSGVAAASAANGTVYLQLGAFSQSANARSLATRVSGQLAEMGLPPATIEQAGQLYRVHVGPYSDRTAAMSAVQTVAEKTGILPSIATH